MAVTGKAIPRLMLEERRSLEDVHVVVPDDQLFEDIHLTKHVFNEGGLRSLDLKADSESQFIDEGMVFERLEDLKL
jgi:hypothetical protein